MVIQDYTVYKQTDSFYILQDPKNDRSYLVVGEHRALLIDTGMCDSPLMPVLRSLTDKPIDLALTHAHIDHMYRYSEFNIVYLHEKEIQAFDQKAQRLMDVGAVLFHIKRKKYPVSSFHPLSDGSTIDLGGVEICCYCLSGHTKGSAVFIDTTHQAVFCGDAVGSGSGVWMFLPDSTSLSEYRTALKRAEAYLLPYRNYQYFGGHGEQDSGENASPLSIQTFTDMRLLCEALLNGTASITRVKQVPLLPLFYASNGMAGIVFHKGKIK